MGSRALGGLAGHAPGFSSAGSMLWGVQALAVGECCESAWHGRQRPGTGADGRVGGAEPGGQAAAASEPMTPMPGCLHSMAGHLSACLPLCAGDTVESKRASAPRMKFGSGSRDQANRLFISAEHEKCQVCCRREGWVHLGACVLVGHARHRWLGEYRSGVSCDAWRS